MGTESTSDLDGLRSAIKLRGRKISVREYAEFRRLHKGFPEAGTLVRRYKSWTRALEIASEGVDGLLFPQGEIFEWDATRVIQFVARWMNSKPPEIDRYTYRRMLAKDQTHQYPDLQTIGEMVDPDFTVVLKVSKAYAKAAKAKNLRNFNYERELESARSSANQSPSPTQGRTADDAERRLQTMFDSGPGL